MRSFADFERLGPIGDSRVERARAPDGRLVALRRLDRGAAGFEDMARIAASIVHPSLVRLLASGVDDDVPWIATELVDSMTLRDLFGDRPVAPDAALILLHPVVDALAAMHAAGLVHGDVRPENVLVRPTGDVILASYDFGLANEGASPPYRSPERLEGRDVDASADVWAFGVVLYELVAGHRPFAHDEEAAIRKGRFTPLAELDPRMSTELDWLLGICLARDPWARPRDGATLRTRLAPFVPVPMEDLRKERMALLSDPGAYRPRERKRAEPAPVRRERTVPKELDDEPPRESPPRRWLPWAAAALVFLFGGGLALWLMWTRPEPPRQAPPPRAPRAAPRVNTSIPPLAREWLANDLPPTLEGLSGEPLLTRADAVALIGTLDPSIERVMVAFEHDTYTSALEELSRRRPDDPNVMLLRAHVAQRNGRFDEARALFSSVLDREPDHVEARLRRGILSDRLGHARDAYDDMHRVLRDRPDETRALAELAHIYNRAGRTYDAVPIVRRIVRLHPHSADAWLDLSVALGDDDREAITAVERALAIAPDHIAALARRCMLLSHLGGFSTINACNVAIEHTPQNSELFMARARAYARERRFTTALEDADRALELAPANAHLLYERYLLRERAGDSGGALRDLSSACSHGHPQACDQLRGAGISP